MEIKLQILPNDNAGIRFHFENEQDVHELKVRFAIASSSDLFLFVLLIE